MVTLGVNNYNLYFDANINYNYLRLMSPLGRTKTSQLVLPLSQLLFDKFF